jgi:hypothetical protein
LSGQLQTSADPGCGQGCHWRDSQYRPDSIGQQQPDASNVLMATSAIVGSRTTVMTARRRAKRNTCWRGQRSPTTHFAARMHKPASSASSRRLGNL